MDIEPNPKFFTAPADTARAMHAAEMRGQDMQDAPERIWAWVWDLGGYGQPHGRREWVDFRPKPFHVSRFMPTGTKWWQVFAGKAVDIEQVVTSYTRTDLCITEAECQRRIDAEREACAVLADEVENGSDILRLGALAAGDSTGAIVHREATVTAKEIAAAIRARGQK